MKKAILYRVTVILLFTSMLSSCKTVTEFTLKGMSFGAIIQSALIVVILAIVIVIFYLGKTNRNQS